MYLEPRRRKRRRSSPWRVLILLLLIGAGIYVYLQIKQQQIEHPFIPTPTPTRSALSYADEAEELYLQGKLAEAIAAYEHALALDPDNVLLYIPLARLLALEGRTVEAGYAYLAEAYADAGRWTEATEAAQTAIKLNDRSVDAHRNYGYVLEMQGNYWEAVKEYERALEIHPNLAYIYIAAGRNYQVLGNLDAAMRSFQRATEVDPENAEAYDQLGWAYFNLGEYEQAETYLKRATEVDPHFGQAFGHLAINYWVRRNYEAAIPNFERAIELECIAARQRASAFYVTIEDRDSDAAGPSSDVALRGDFVPVSKDNLDTLRTRDRMGRGTAD